MNLIISSASADDVSDKQRSTDATGVSGTLDTEVPGCDQSDSPAKEIDVVATGAAAEEIRKDNKQMHLEMQTVVQKQRLLPTKEKGTQRCRTGQYSQRTKRVAQRNR